LLECAFCGVWTGKSLFSHHNFTATTLVHRRDKIGFLQWSPPQGNEMASHAQITVIFCEWHWPCNRRTHSTYWTQVTYRTNVCLKIVLKHFCMRDQHSWLTRSFEEISHNKLKNKLELPQERLALKKILKWVRESHLRKHKEWTTAVSRDIII
jgi:hypothetical protein